MMTDEQLSGFIRETLEGLMHLRLVSGVTSGLHNHGQVIMFVTARHESDDPELDKRFRITIEEA